jgi:hypothetical protein
MKLKIYTDFGLFTEGRPVDLLIPFIGINNEEYSEGRLYAHTFDEFIRLSPEIIELTTIEQCDVCLFPVYFDPSWNNPQNASAIISQFINLIEASGKKIIVFLGHDLPFININIKNAILFSGTIDKSKQFYNSYSYPHFFSDLIAYNHSEFTPRFKTKIPVVGFCGYAPPFGMKLSREKIIGTIKLLANYTGLIKKFPYKVSHSYRARAILGLNNSKKVKLNFKLKSAFAFGPSGQLNTGNTKESDIEFRQNFIKNILESDYTLCVRGIGNNSIRFFETLCCGRIPVFVNTDSALPFDNIMDWRRLCVWVEEEDIDKIDEIVLKFHNNITEEKFIELQKELRHIWTEFLSPQGFYKNLHLFLN